MTRYRSRWTAPHAPGTVAKVRREHDDQHDNEAAAAAAQPAAVPLAAAVMRVLALQRTAGNQAVGRLLRGSRLARWDTPLQGGVPAGKKATDLSAFLDIVRAEEAKLPVEEQTNTKLMITRLRKLFYGNKGWDDYLIPGAKGVKPLYTFEEKETGRREWEVPGPNVVEMVDKTPHLVGAPAALENPGDIQEVRMPNGDFVDVGHVLAGLDAQNHPSNVAPMWMYDIASNMDAVTWAGDLGSILAEVLFQRAKLGRPLNDPEVQAQIDEMAPVQDMLGNVDAYAIGDAFDVGTAAGKKVSEILAEFYGGVGTASAKGTTAHAKRFTTFAAKLGLVGFDGSNFSNEAAWLTKRELDVGKAGALYVGASSEMKKLGLTYSVGGKLGLMDGVRDSPFRRTLLEKFLAQIKVKVAAEAKAAAPAGVP
jgi:hypothetical protein